MLTDELKTQLRSYLQHVKQEISLDSSLGSDEKSIEMRKFLIEISDLSDKVFFNENGKNKRRPSFDIRRVGTDISVTFAGVPLGHEFSSLVLALLQVGGHPPKIEETQKERILSLTGSYHFETYFSLSCHNCPEVVQALNTMSVLNPRIRHTAIEGGSFSQEVSERDIRSVPQVFLNGEPFATGRMDLEQILARIDKEGEKRAVESLNEEAPFDALVIGSGPAGAASAIYLARKGLRTGLVAERFGGQMMETAGIENFISVPETEGIILSGNLEAHVRRYDIRIMPSQLAARLVPAKNPGDYHEVFLENGARLEARTIIVATGARVRSLGITGEETYRTRGVTYCPHCDGPFYKGRPVAVAGGGNSGVEAAIDLAGIVSHVTLIQRNKILKADQVLQDKLSSLPNVTVIKNAVPEEIRGDGKVMTNLLWKDKETGEQHELDVDAIFIQVGLDPNSDWVRGALDLTDRGEIIIDERCRTSVPGIFAAGDVTTVPHKQIIIAMGEGAKAALAAFDYMIRTPG